jgi:hypothetical protein
MMLIKYVVHTVFGEKFGPYESENPYEEHRDLWGKPPKEYEAKMLSSKVLQAVRIARYYENNGNPIVYASPDYWIEILKP